jgi:pyruvate dehydrogenase E2 component (dihydrolipoamide acetyltransferase)
MAIEEIKVPDIGDFKNVAIIELLVNVGDSIAVDQSLLTLESDKATMEIPSSKAGVVKELKVKLGDKISEGSLILLLDVAETVTATAPVLIAPAPAPAAPTQRPEATLTPSSIEAVEPSELLPIPIPTQSADPLTDEIAFKRAYATPSVRRFARTLGVDLGKVTGSGRNGRILEEDVQAFVKKVLTEGVPAAASAAPVSAGSGIPEIPAVDFSKFGEIETRPLSRIKKLSGTSLHRSWLNVPHVTQFDDADITDLEQFRKDLTEEGKKHNVKVTMLTFLLKACAAALKQYPDFNASLDPSKENLILKKYFHIGVAVDTPDGLVVPVIRDVNQKGLFDLAAELGEISKKARDKKLSAADMQGASFTISSLGGIGGTAFTPIVNAPEVAILGVSKSSMKPVYQDGQFVPRLILPLSLSYDHRVIDGAAAARFTTYLGFILSDVRRLLL